MSNTPYVQSLIKQTIDNPRYTRGKEVFDSRATVTILKLEKARKLDNLKEVLAAKVERENICSNRTIGVDIKKTCADEIAALNREILVLRSELNQINSILPDKFSEAEHAIVNPPMNGGRKHVINSIKNSKTKYKSHRKNKLSKSHRHSRKLKSRKANA
jgi:hypothetical protein